MDLAGIGKSVLLMTFLYFEKHGNQDGFCIFASEILRWKYYGKSK